VVFGYDIDPDRQADMVEAGGHLSRSAGELAGDVDLVITSLPSESSFRRVATEIGQSAHPGLVVADTSTLAAHVKQSMAAFVAKNDVILLDCPLSGTGEQARAKDLVALMSGPREQVEAAATVFRVFCRKCTFVGDLGQGSDLKLVANHLVAVHTMAAAEALNLARRAGLDPSVVIETLSDSAAGSKMLEVRGPVIANRTWHDAAMRLDLFIKDLGLIGDLALRTQSRTPLFEKAVDHYRTAQRLGLGACDSASVVETLRNDDEP
jgi:3-hydroxyisobutyrate dehydrogenase-like beta-hydroxyacid dehydrogenase